VLVVTVNVTLADPVGTVTLAGTFAAAVLPVLVNGTTAPPAGAAPLSVTIPVVEVPPTTVAGLNESEVITSGLTVRVDDPWVPL
jgi:hypothetical protein